MRKRSGKPGASHLIALQNAHGKGDYEASRRAALAYANECTAHCKSTHMKPDAKGALPSTDRRAALARIAASRRKQA